MSTAIVQRAGYGDIINILPLARIISLWEAEPPTLFVAADKVSFLDGCSYVRPAVADLNLLPQQLRESLSSRFDRVLVSDVCGTGISYQRRCSSFTKEAWDRCGMLPYWGIAPPLLFDRRDYDREKKLFTRSVLGKKPLILVNLHGKSAPFPEAKEVLKHLTERHLECAVLNLATVRADRLYDLLGLFEHAAALVTIDTSTLHLAGASNIPVISFTTDKPELWHGSVTRKEAVLSISYSEVMDRIHEVDSSLVGLTHCLHGIPHVYSKFAVSPLAAQTWRSVYERSYLRPFPVTDSQLPRLFSDGPRQLPFVRDLLDMAFAQPGKQGYVVLSNSDTCLAPIFAVDMQRRDNKLLTGVCYWSQRRDFSLLLDPLDQANVSAGEKYSGTDLFVISKKWWGQFRNTLPDLVLGAEGWDCCFRELMRITGGEELEDRCYHERHANFWERPENRYTLKSQKHNQRLSKTFLRSLGVDPAPHGFK